MTDWKSYLVESDPSPVKKKKKKGPGCKRNRISRNKFGLCFFTDQEECLYCKRPRKKIVKLNPKTNKIEIEYLE